MGITARWTFARDLLAGGVGPVTVIDCDLWFFSSPEPVFEEIGDALMAVLPHGFAPAARGLPGITMESHRQCGLYNAGWVTFGDLAPAADFAELCRQGPIAYREQPDENGVLLGEQGCLESLAIAIGAHVIAHPGAAPGPWCANAQELRQFDDDSLQFGGRPLVAWHYHSFRLGEQLANAEYELPVRLAALVYGPYRDALLRAM